MKDELGRKIMKEFIGLKAKTYCYIIDDDNEDEKVKRKWVIKGKLKFKDYKNCLEANQLENKINHPAKKEIDADSLKKDRKEFIKNNKLLIKTQQRFKS